jgi:hypothetical protein
MNSSEQFLSLTSLQFHSVWVDDPHSKDMKLMTVNDLSVAHKQMIALLISSRNGEVGQRFRARANQVTKFVQYGFGY